MSIFKRKWKSKDSKIRLQWIKDANPENSKHDSILSSLAQTDRDDEVCEAAIERLLNAIALLIIVKSDKDDTIRKKAAQRLVSLAKNKPEVLLDDWEKIAKVLNAQKHNDVPGESVHADNTNRSHDCTYSAYHTSGGHDDGFTVNFPKRPPKL